MKAAGWGLEPAGEQRGADIIREVGDDVIGAAGGRVGVDRHRVAVDHGQPAIERLRQFAEEGQAAVVALDRDHPCAGTEQRARQAAGTGTDLEHRLRSEEHTSELQSLMRISYAVFCLKKKKTKQYTRTLNRH